MKQAPVKKILRWFLYGTYLAGSVLLLLELSYRFYLIDFYRGELKVLNPPELLEPKKDPSNILILGDSFTADPKSYVSHLRRALPAQSVINSGVSGTCIRQAALMAPSRIKEFQPDVFIYQIYVGNDLMEFRHDVSSSRISFVRRCYWWLADRIPVLGFLNYRLRGFSKYFYQDLQQSHQPQLVDNFSPAYYSARTKMHFQAEPYWIENATTMTNGRAKDARQFSKKMKNMLADLPEHCQVILLVIPHCMQVNALYRDRMFSLGAQHSRPEIILNPEYPFVKGLERSLANDQVRVLNPLPLFQEQSADKILYYENDPHLNPLGQEVLGRFVLDFMEEEGIFEKIDHQQ